VSPWIEGQRPWIVSGPSDGNAKALAKGGYGVTGHAFAKAGDYIVTVEHANERRERAVGHLRVRIE
jgi:hypothetical protein